MKRQACGLLVFLALAPALLLGACAPMTQHALTPAADFRGPSLQSDGFVSYDGARLGMSTWLPEGLPEGREPWAVIVGVHGMNDYAQTFWMAAPYWAGHGIATYAYDQRGFGRSPGKGVFADEKVSVEDLRTICVLVRARYPHAVIAVAGESMGGAVSIQAFASDRPPDADRLILLSPAVWGWSHQPVINRAALWVAAHTFGSHSIDTPEVVSDHIFASNNIPELKRMGRDPDMVWGTRPDSIYALVTLMDHASRNIGKVRGPVAYFYGAHDQVITKDSAFDAAALLPPEGRKAYYAEGWHLLMRDYEAPVVWGDVMSFIKDPNAPWPSGAPPIPPAVGEGRRRPGLRD